MATNGAKRHSAAITDGPGRAGVAWDGLSDGGDRVAPGVYWVRVRDRAGEATRAVVVRK